MIPVNKMKWLMALIPLFFICYLFALPDYYTLWVPINNESHSAVSYEPVSSLPKYRPLPSLSVETPLRIAISSDPHFGRKESNLEATRNIIRTINTAVPPFHAFFVLGDWVEYGFIENQWLQCREVLAESVNVPIVPLMGNHDDLMNGREKYLQYLIPEASMQNSRKILWQRIDLGTVHFIKLNLMWGTEDWGEDTQQWLEGELASIPSEDWVIVLSHCFMYSSGNYTYGVPWFDHPETTTIVAPILETYGVDLCVSGHNHHMELLEKDGIHYILIGSFGGVPTSGKFDKISDYSKWVLRGKHGFVDLMIYPEEIDLAFRDQKGTVIQTFTIFQNPNQKMVP